jgi:hypothetical protein
MAIHSIVSIIMYYDNEQLDANVDTAQQRLAVVAAVEKKIPFSIFLYLGFCIGILTLNRA